MYMFYVHVLCVLYMLCFKYVLSHDIMPLFQIYKDTRQTSQDVSTSVPLILTVSLGHWAITPGGASLVAGCNSEYLYFPGTSAQQPSLVTCDIVLPVPAGPVP